MRRSRSTKLAEEHHLVKLLIGELKRMSPEDERHDAKYKVLSESVKHIEEEGLLYFVIVVKEPFLKTKEVIQCA
jgi:hypothetical protein